MLLFTFNIKSFSQNYISATDKPINGNICHTGGNVGIGIQNPQAKLHIDSSNGVPDIRLTELSGSESEDDTIEIGQSDKSFSIHQWDIDQDGSNLNIDFTSNNNTVNIMTIQPHQILVNGQISATKFIGDGSGLTNLPGSYWYKDPDFYNNLTYDGDIVIGDGNLTKDGQAEFIKIRTNHQDWFIGREEQDSDFI